MFDIKQFIPNEFCLACKGCCRFAEENSIWQPSLLDHEVDILPKPTKMKALVFEGDYICSFLDAGKNQCKIYLKRPFECRLYPFLINKTKHRVYLCVDLNCPFIRGKLDKKEFRDYFGYLVDFLNLPDIAFALRRNLNVFTDYSQSRHNLQNLTTLKF